MYIHGFELKTTVHYEKNPPQPQNILPAKYNCLGYIITYAHEEIWFRIYNVMKSIYKLRLEDYVYRGGKCDNHE